MKTELPTAVIAEWLSITFGDVCFKTRKLKLKFIRAVDEKKHFVIIIHRES